ncbi:hypothetical protein BH10BAC6_BH10BAC6_18840 [soil metagenome]
MKTQPLLIIALILTTVCVSNAQVPFDVSKAVLAKTVMNVLTIVRIPTVNFTV